MHAAAHDYDSFALHEDEARERHGYPPYVRLLRVVWEDEDEKRVIEASDHAAKVLRQELAEHKVQIMGPAPAPMALQRGRHRRHVMLKAPIAGQGMSRARAVLSHLHTQRPRMAIDVDPTSMM